MLQPESGTTVIAAACISMLVPALGLDVSLLNLQFLVNHEKSGINFSKRFWLVHHLLVRAVCSVLNSDPLSDIAAIRPLSLLNLQLRASWTYNSPCGVAKLQSCNRSHR